MKAIINHEGTKRTKKFNERVENEFFRMRSINRSAD
jgi:hypothetical protein